MTKLWAAALGGVLLMTGSQAISAERVRNAVLPNGLPVSQFKLTNGLQIYVVENHSAPVFTYQTWFKVGAKDEKLDPRLNATGLAHLFEHMMFRGTTAHPDGEFDDILARNGVSDENATTWLDRTNYYESLPKEGLELAMQLESDRMAHLALDQNLLDTERGAVLGEYRMGLDDPDSVANDKLYAAAFLTHPYHYTTIGTEDEIKRFTIDDANYFYRKYYAPNNAVLLVVGDVDPDGVTRLAEKYYGAYASQDVTPAVAPVEPPQTSERQVEFTHGQLTQSKLLIGYHTPAATHADQAALWVAQSLLTVGEGSLLRGAWVNSGLAVSVSGGLDHFRDPGLLQIAADIQNPHAASELLGALDAALGGVGADSIDGDVARARNQLLLGVYASWEENSSLASFMGEGIGSADDPLFVFSVVAALDQVTAADVRRVVSQYLVPANRTVVVGRPVAVR